MAKFIGSVKEQALKYAQIGKPKSPAEINRRIYTGLGPDWEPIVLAQSEQMLTMSTDKLQSLLIGHEERRLYTVTQNLQTVTPASTPLSGILGSAPEIHYTSGRDNQGGHGNGGGKGNGKVGKGKERVREAVHMVGGPSLVKDRTEEVSFTLIKSRVGGAKASGRTGKNFRASGPASLLAAQFLLAAFLSAQPSTLGPDLWCSDLRTHQELMRGPVNDSLYCFHLRDGHSNSPQIVFDESSFPYRTDMPISVEVERLSSGYASAPGSEVPYECALGTDVMLAAQNTHGMKEFAMKDPGPLHFFLGMEACKNFTELYLTQSKYIHDILARTSMLECKRISSPVTTGSRLSLHDGCSFKDPSLYISVMGSLQYLSLTRPDIAYVVNQAGNPDDRRSVSGFVIFLGSNPISWSSKKQQTITRSSTESENKCLANVTAEIL
ncbi:hypothetical protein CRG98_029844 [Punica granatum]|uniref:Reverse transcriptase Ty1/copia-type domain-containing protein n=1 Tax=Punica granatum TaxID=22663 RepID=A0A2I0J0N9_PUNGR|nr:hypothetical protein CRG98_029844 [Punica granatum]